MYEHVNLGELQECSYSKTISNSNNLETTQLYIKRKCINAFYYIDTMEYYTALRWNELKPHTDKSQRSQIQERTHYKILFMYR